MLGRRRATGRKWQIRHTEEMAMNGLIWIVGLVVIVLFILGFLGLR